MGQLKKGIFAFDAKQEYDTSSFSCGRPELDEFLQKNLARQQENHVLRAYFILSDDPIPQVMGYYTLSGGCFIKTGMSNARRKQVPYRDTPCILLGRLAVDQRLSGKGFGSMLVADAARRVYEAAQSVGVYAIMTEAKDGKAAKFYEGLGFIKLNTEDSRLLYFYPTNSIESIIDQYPPI